MTKQEILDKLSSRIRKSTPHLMELREGCIIELDGIQAEIVLSNYEFENGCTYLLRNKERLWYATDEDLKHSKIIGHDIILNDVLYWLQSLSLSMEIQSCNKENMIGLYYISIDEKGDTHEEYVTWNLLSTYLKDQTEELIKFLYNIKINK